jgi:hypothetical protein
MEHQEPDPGDPAGREVPVPGSAVPEGGEPDGAMSESTGPESAGPESTAPKSVEPEGAKEVSAVSASALPEFAGPAGAASGLAAAASPPRATGEPRVDAALKLLERLPGLPVAAHAELLEQVHAQLSEVLSELESGSSGPARG